MAIKTTEEQLEEVQAAITAVMSNQSYTIDGRSFTRANLASLEAREERLQKKYAAKQGTRPRLTSINLSNMGY